MCMCRLRWNSHVQVRSHILMVCTSARCRLAGILERGPCSHRLPSGLPLAGCSGSGPSWTGATHRRNRFGHTTRVRPRRKPPQDPPVELHRRRGRRHFSARQRFAGIPRYARDFAQPNLAEGKFFSRIMGCSVRRVPGWQVDEHIGQPFAAGRLWSARGGTNSR